MSKRKYYNHNNQEETIEAVMTPEESIQEEVASEEPIVEEDKVVRVTGCMYLNLRQEPTKKSMSLAVLSFGEELTLKDSESSDEWFKVQTKEDLEGYCLKRFLELQ